MAYNTILLLGDRAQRQDELRAGGAITPGHLLMRNSSDALVVHGTAVIATEKIVALEDDFQGRTIDNAYASGELVFYHICQPGDVLYMLVPAAAAAIVKGDRLVSNGDGTLKKIAAETNDVFGTALDAVDNSAGGAPVRIRVRSH